jgi:hypothetical protein
MWKRLGSGMCTPRGLDRCHKGLWGTPLGTWSSGSDVDVTGQAAFCLLIHADPPRRVQGPRQTT